MGDHFRHGKKWSRNQILSAQQPPDILHTYPILGIGATKPAMRYIEKAYIGPGLFLITMEEAGGASEH
jgi:hypothetical protein